MRHVTDLLDVLLQGNPFEETSEDLISLNIDSILPFMSALFNPRDKSNMITLEMCMDRIHLHLYGLPTNLPTPKSVKSELLTSNTEDSVITDLSEDKQLVELDVYRFIIIDYSSYSSKTSHSMSISVWFAAQNPVGLENNSSFCLRPGSHNDKVGNNGKSENRYTPMMLPVVNDDFDLGVNVQLHTNLT